MVWPTSQVTRGPGVEEAEVAAARVPDGDGLVGHPGPGAERVLDAQVEALAVLDEPAELLAEARDVLVDPELQPEGLGVAVDQDGRCRGQPGDLAQALRGAQHDPTPTGDEQASGYRPTLTSSVSGTERPRRRRPRVT